jgi:hypothetical protein
MALTFALATGGMPAVGGDIGVVRGERPESLVPLLATVASVRRRLRGAELSSPLSADRTPRLSPVAELKPPGGVDPFIRATRLRMPGTLSGPRRLGIASYSHGLFRRMQFWHDGRPLSQRILRPRLLVGFKYEGTCGDDGPGWDV